MCYFAKKQLTLSSLDMSQDDGRGEHVAKWLSAHHFLPLEKLTWGGRSDNTLSFLNLLHACSSTLQQLTLSMDTWSNLDWSLGKHSYIYHNAFFV